MTIFVHRFSVPFSIDSAAQLNLDELQLFSQPIEIPPNHTMDLTPEGYRDKYVLKTINNPQVTREDTIGIVQITRQGGQKISGYSYGVEGGGRHIETEKKTVFQIVNTDTPICIIARPNELDGGEGIRVDAIIRYE